MEAKPIVTSLQAEEDVHGIPTQVVCSAFDDRILVLVTQFGKMGNLVSLTPNVVSSDIGKPSITTKVLLGKDEPLTHVCTKNLVTFVSEESGNKPVLLGLALKDHSVEAIKALKEMIQRCKVW